MSELPTDDQLAFDYVSGAMRGDERKAFGERLLREPQLQGRVHFWEEELIAMSDIREERPTDPATWKTIEARINTTTTATGSPQAQHNPSRHSWWQRWWLPAASVAFGVVALAVMLFSPLHTTAPAPNYVAVLTDTQGTPVLTALSSLKARHLSLKWEALKVSPDKNLQLWAVSRNDGQIRSLAVFTQADQREMTLNDTHIHLIRDAAYLWLTEEEPGGSPLDEPSEKILAKGACVFLDKTQTL
jgi:anti-sigma-K factor RskA